MTDYVPSAYDLYLKRFLIARTEQSSTFSTTNNPGYDQTKPVLPFYTGICTRMQLIYGNGVESLKELRTKMEPS